MIPNTQNKMAASEHGNSYLFTGRRFDGSTGSYYFRNRYYEPKSVRFMGRDPLGYIDSMNLYVYVLNNPGTNIDPLGLMDDWGDMYDWFNAKQKADELDEIIEAMNDARDYNKKNSTWYTSLPDCPCKNPDLDDVKTNDSWASEGTSHAHPGAAECFRSYPKKGVNQLKLDGPGQQCCYDDCGNLITGGAAAGTPDRYNSTEGETSEGKVNGYYGQFRVIAGRLFFIPKGGPSHVIADYFPWKKLGWKKYNLYWPPNQGKDANSKPCKKNIV